MKAILQHLVSHPTARRPTKNTNRLFGVSLNKNETR